MVHIHVYWGHILTWVIHKHNRKHPNWTWITQYIDTSMCGTYPCLQRSSTNLGDTQAQEEAPQLNLDNTIHWYIDTLIHQCVVHIHVYWGHILTWVIHKHNRKHPNWTWITQYIDTSMCGTYPCLLRSHTNLGDTQTQEEAPQLNLDNTIHWYIDTSMCGTYPCLLKSSTNLGGTCSRGLYWSQVWNELEWTQALWCTERVELPRLLADH